jgi:fructose-1,6-bisphosphatase/sedoheptulose 1,7-bisphosphatase-like protein
MGDVTLGKQRFELDWDTGEVIDLDPYLKRLIERLASTAKMVAQDHEAGCPWVKPCTCGAMRLALRANEILARGGMVAGSGEFDSSALLYILEGPKVGPSAELPKVTLGGVHVS